MLSRVNCVNLSRNNNIFRFGDSVASLSPARSGLFAATVLHRNFSSDENSPKNVPSQSAASSGLIQNGQQMVKNKLNSIYGSYERLSHMDEIREAHQNVESLQEELKVVQERRREVSKELNDIRYELKLCYADLANCQKGEPRYLELIRREYEASPKSCSNISNKIFIDILFLVRRSAGSSITRKSWRPKISACRTRLSATCSRTSRRPSRLPTRRRRSTPIRPSTGPSSALC